MSDADNDALIKEQRRKQRNVRIVQAALVVMLIGLIWLAFNLPPSVVRFFSAALRLLGAFS